MNPEQGTELRSGKIISSSLETPVQTDPDMAQSSANDSDSNETSDISSQLSEIRESYERKINELQSELSQLKDLMMAVISKTDGENRPSSSKGPSKPVHTPGSDSQSSEVQSLCQKQRDNERKLLAAVNWNEKSDTIKKQQKSGRKPQKNHVVMGLSTERKLHNDLLRAACFF